MRVHEGLPGGASGNYDIVTGKRPNGGRWLSLGVEEAQVPQGLLSIHESTVEMMVEKLGWKLQTKKARDEVAALRIQVAEQADRIEGFERAAEQVIEAFGGVVVA